MRIRRNYLVLAIIFATWVNSAYGQGKKAGATPSSSSAAQPAASTPTASGSSVAIEAQMLAFGALDHIAASIATTVCARLPEPQPREQPPVPTSSVVIYDQASFATLQSYEAFIENAKAIVSLYESLLTPDEFKELNKKLADMMHKEHPDRPAPRAIGLSSTIDPFSDATSLLSAIAVSSNSESPGSITIPDSAMAVAVAKELKNSCDSKLLNVVYPPLFGNSSTTDFSSADIQSDLQKIHDVRTFAVAKVEERNTKWMQDNKFPIGNPVLTGALTDVNGMYDSFMNSLLQVNSSSGGIGSGSVIQGYQLANVLAGPPEKNGSYKHPAFILLASVVSAGGTELDHKTLWTALSTGDKITYSGGLIVNVSLWHSDDKEPIYSDLLRYRVPFSNVQQPSNLGNSTVGDNLPKRSR
jgi:hypothetical protein